MRCYRGLLLPWVPGGGSKNTTQKGLPEAERMEAEHEHAFVRQGLRRAVRSCCRQEALQAGFGAGLLVRRKEGDLGHTTGKGGSHWIPWRQALSSQSPRGHDPMESRWGPLSYGCWNSTDTQLRGTSPLHPIRPALTSGERPLYTHITRLRSHCSDLAGARLAPDYFEVEDSSRHTPLSSMPFLTQR